MRTTIMILLMALNVWAALSPLDWFSVINLISSLYGLYAIYRINTKARQL